jgi:integrase
MRLGELLGLDWTAVDTKARTITVRQNWTRQSRTHGVSTPKTDKERTVDMSTTLAAQLEVFRKHRKTEELKNGNNMLPAPVFANEIGERLDGRNVTRALHALCVKAKVRKRGVHSCRDTFASELLSMGKPVLYVSAQLGHSNSAVTWKHYSKWIPRDETSRREVDDLPTFASKAR